MPLRYGDLKDLIIPVISVDQWNSKISNEKFIVVSFFIKDKNAAYELNSFIQKSECEIYDTETPLIPDENMHYIVFVEIERNEKFKSILKELIHLIENLCLNKHWQMKIYKIKDILDFNDENLDKINLSIEK